MSIFIFVSKLTIFNGKKFEIFEFSRLNWSKIVISWFYLGNYRSKSRFFCLKILICIWHISRISLNFGAKIQIRWFTRFRQNSILWTKIGLLTQCVIEEGGPEKCRFQNHFYSIPYLNHSPRWQPTVLAYILKDELNWYHF